MNGFLFPKDDINVLTKILLKVISRSRLSPLAHNVASIGKGTAKNMKAIEAIEGYASLLENILKLPSEVAVPKPFADIPSKYKSEWRWSVLNMIRDVTYRSRDVGKYLDKIEDLNKTEPSIPTSVKDEDFLYSIWEEQKQIDSTIARKRREDAEVSKLSAAMFVLFLNYKLNELVFVHSAEG